MFGAADHTPQRNRCLYPAATHKEDDGEQEMTLARACRLYQQRPLAARQHSINAGLLKGRGAPNPPPPKMAA